MESNIEIINNFIRDIAPIAKKDCFGIKRWDNAMISHQNSGTVKIPVEVGYRVFSNPFYYFIEELGDEKSLLIKPVKGEPCRFGDVAGFFGLSYFSEYKLGLPIILVEGISDLVAVKKHYKWVLSTLTSGVTQKQMFILSNLTKKVFAGFDNDFAGNNGSNLARKKFMNFNVRVQRILPVRDDWGKLSESDWGMEMIEKTFDNLNRNGWFNKC